MHGIGEVGEAGEAGTNINAHDTLAPAGCSYLSIWNLQLFPR